jgi:tRNA threonylcarbamoyladenosine biosynthesis protein TsaE
VRWQAQTGEDTEAFGGQLALTRPAGDALTVVYLSGELGAGKTTLARGFLRACGVRGPVRSPTYTLVEIYDTPGLSVLHVDLFRLHEEADTAPALGAHSELEGLGLREWAVPGFAWLVEWPERGAGQLPPFDLSVTLRSGSSEHVINVIAGTPLGDLWLKALSGGH